MYVLDCQAFRGVDTKRIKQFVECWERFYRGNVRLSNSPELIDYFQELNLSHNLSEQNVTRLLRWKDPRMLTHPKQESKGSAAPNRRVQRVLERLERINQFRGSRLSESEFAEVTQEVFPNGIIWQLFLFHMAQPWRWPIADQHVFRARSLLFNSPAPNTIESFRAYADQFHTMAKSLREDLHIDEHDVNMVVQANKRLDNALMAYGQFLKTYESLTTCVRTIA